MSEPLLSLADVSLGYGEKPVLSGVSFAVARGEFVGIFGPNGSGKSTLLKGILGLLAPLEGEIEVAGYKNRELVRARRLIGYCPQQENPGGFPATALEVVLMGLYAKLGWFRRPGRDHRRQAREALEAVGMEEYAEHLFAELSGGQRQRVFLARALVADPAILLLDEPTAAVDIAAQASILVTIERLHRERGLTVLMVSHDINEIVHSCQKILLLHRGVVGYGPPAAVLTLSNLQKVYGPRVLVYQHHGHPHVLVGDFDA
ncbi:MAG: metal ABC transporter ATP-binding protein [Firmicutes bacterium]|nr:metal ABC transporter ATP-binding protein [Bacillota bacterium]